jgi:hypothetical protein
MFGVVEVADARSEGEGREVTFINQVLFRRSHFHPPPAAPITA